MAKAASNEIHDSVQLRVNSMKLADNLPVLFSPAIERIKNRKGSRRSKVLLV